uniref:Uncharacterized protein n=1 Tax=Oryza nivara TaxID=4536 RepID=A0A0E0I2V7_ORYNI
MTHCRGWKRLSSGPCARGLVVHCLHERKKKKRANLSKRSFDTYVTYHSESGSDRSRRALPLRARLAPQEGAWLEEEEERRRRFLAYPFLRVKTFFRCSDGRCLALIATFLLGGFVLKILPYMEVGAALLSSATMSFVLELCCRKFFGLFFVWVSLGFLLKPCLYEINGVCFFLKSCTN